MFGNTRGIPKMIQNILSFLLISIMSNKYEPRYSIVWADMDNACMR